MLHARNRSVVKLKKKGGPAGFDSLEPRMRDFLDSAEEDRAMTLRNCPPGYNHFVRELIGVIDEVEKQWLK